jgi:SAM-dependent methyltransferase
MEEKIKLQEKEQGRRIQYDADKVWGWSTPAGILRANRRLKEFLPYLGPERHNRILEIGCGTGIFTNLFYHNGITPVAIDISYDLLKKAKNRNPELILIQADAENLPFKKNVFGCVLGVSVLHHLNINPVLENIRAVLRDEGIMIFSEPNMANPQVFLQKRLGWLKKLMHDTPSETAFLRWHLKMVLRVNGFSCIGIRPFDFLHPLTPRCVIPIITMLQQYLERVPIIKEIAGSLLIAARK